MMSTPAVSLLGDRHGDRGSNGADRRWPGPAPVDVQLWIDQEHTRRQSDIWRRPCLRVGLDAPGKRTGHGSGRYQGSRRQRTGDQTRGGVAGQGRTTAPVHRLVPGATKATRGLIRGICRGQKGGWKALDERTNLVVCLGLGGQRRCWRYGKGSYRQAAFVFLFVDGGTKTQGL